MTPSLKFKRHLWRVSPCIGTADTVLRFDGRVAHPWRHSINEGGGWPTLSRHSINEGAPSFRGFAKGWGTLGLFYE
jgi:hypothetical protein